MTWTRRSFAMAAAAASVSAAHPRTVDPTIVEAGFKMTEGPVWTPRASLLFTELRRSEVREWRPGASESVLIRSDDSQPNGLAFSPSGVLHMCEMRGRRVSAWRNGAAVTVVDRYQDKPLNSPNDLVFDADGGIYFTDPPFGLRRRDNDPAKKLSFNGVFYQPPKGDLTLMTDQLSRPNGIALIDDGARLVVSNSDPKGRFWVTIDLKAPGRPGKMSTFAVLPKAEPRGAPDGMAVGPDGCLYATGADAIWRLNKEGRMNTVARLAADRPSNCAVGGPENTTLFITGRKAVYQLAL